MSVEDAWHDRKGKRTKRYGRGKRWRVRNRGARTESFTRKTDADRRDRDIGSQLDRAGYIDPRAGRESFTSYAERHVRDRGYGAGSMSVVNARLGHLTAYFGERQMREVTPSSVKAFKATLAERRTIRTGEPMAPATQNLVFGLLVSVMRAAVVDEVITRDPTAGIPRPPVRSRKVARVWEQTAVSAILAAVPDRHHAAVAFAAQCGLRRGECLAVASGDVDFLRKQVTVRHQVSRRDGKLTLVPPKGGKVRTVPLPKVTRDALSAHIERYGSTSVRCRCCKTTHDVLFVDRGQLWDVREFARAVWHPTLRMVGVEPSRHAGMHQLRHFYASVLIDNGASAKQVQSYLGHASIRTTLDIYADLFEASHDRARDIIDAAFNADESGAYPSRTAQDR